MRFDKRRVTTWIAKCEQEVTVVVVVVLTGSVNAHMSVFDVFDRCVDETRLKYKLEMLRLNIFIIIIIKNIINHIKYRGSQRTHAVVARRRYFCHNLDVHCLRHSL